MYTTSSMVLIRQRLPLILFALTLGVSPLQSQDGSEPEVDDRSNNVVIAVTAGPVYTTSRGDFPSLLLGDQQVGTGDYLHAGARTGNGYRGSIQSLFPFNRYVGLNVGFGTQRSILHFSDDTTARTLRMDLQTFLLGIGVEGTPIVNREAFNGFGFRSVHALAGFDFHFGPLANRVEVSREVDTLTGEIRGDTGSFQSSSPFTTGIHLKGGAGVRVGLDRYLEVLLQGEWSVELNRLFASSAILENDLSVRHLALTAGLAYRF